MKLILDSVIKSFGSKHVLTGASMTFEQDKIYGLLGRNGSGKTTLFNCLSDEIQFDGGSATIESASEPARSLNADDIGYVFSTPILPDFLTGYEYVKFYMEVNGQDRHAQPDEWFDRFSIAEEDRHRLIKGYSMGMKNKLQMLCCFLARPPVMLLDEPLTSLDVVVALEIKKLLLQMKTGRILIFSTHILQLATDLCDEIVVLHDGTLELIDQETLHSSDFEARLIHILSDGEEGDKDE